jgi:hypothetical protein
MNAITVNAARMITAPIAARVAKGAKRQSVLVVRMSALIAESRYAADVRLCVVSVKDDSVKIV